MGNLTGKRLDAAPACQVGASSLLSAGCIFLEPRQLATREVSIAQRVFNLSAALVRLPWRVQRGQQPVCGAFTADDGPLDERSAEVVAGEG